MGRRFPALAVGALLAAAGTFAQTQPARTVPSLKLEHYQLANGMGVIFYVDRRAPVVHVNLRFYVGSKDERPGRTGFAHLFEHMMYQGVDAKSHFFALTAELGASGENGATGIEATEYYETVPTAHLERMLWLESNRFANLPSILTQERLDNQREVVRNELRQKVENTPYARFYAAAFENLFPVGHPYAHEVLGTHQDLMEASLDDVRSFYRDSYTPDNLCLMLAGDFDPAQARAWIAKYFGSWAPGPVRVRPVQSTPQLSEPKRVEIRDHVPDERIFFAWPTPGLFDPDEAALEVAGFVLSNEWARLRSTKERADVESVEIGSQVHLDASLFHLTVTARTSAAVEEIDKAVTADLTRLAQEGPTDEDLTRARNNLEFTQIKGLEDLHQVAFTVQALRQHAGSPDGYGKWLNRYRNVTADSVRAAVARWLATPNRLAVHFTRETARRDGTAEPNRTQAPPFQPERPYGAPEVKAAKLANGLQVLVMERHELPLVAVEIRFKLGSADDPPGKNGVALMTMATADSGTARRSKAEIDKEKSRLAIEIHGNADAASQTAGFEVLRDNLEPAMDLLADLMQNATFSPDAFEAAKKEAMDQVEKTEGRIDDYVGHAMAIAFGSRHPLGNLVFGTRESRRAITPKDAADFKNLHWKPGMAALAFAGDITLDDAVALAKKYLGDWSGSGKQAAFSAPEPMAGRLFLVDKPGATQTMVVQALPGIPRDSPDYPAMFLLNRIWGGMFGSRLNQDIREAQGIAYGAGSEMFHFPGYGLWLARSPVQADKTHEALLAFARELRGLAERPVTAEELALAKSTFLSGYPDEFAQVWPAVEHIARDWAAGLPLDDLRTLPQRVAAVTLEQVNAAARKYAKPERAFFLLLGDREKIGQDLGDLGMGDVKTLQ